MTSAGAATGEPDRFSSFLREPEILTQALADDGVFPNNPALPAILMRGAMDLPDADPASAVEAVFHASGWGGSWRNGVYAFHHYHSTAHEVLGCYGGSATIQLGGPEGMVVRVERGDVVVIPAGVAHKNLGQTDGFRVVGAYPAGQRPDMCYGRQGERPGSDDRIARVPPPDADPVFGTDGPLVRAWK